MMKKRGMTLIELMVAISIFVIVMTLAIGGFVSISRIRAQVGSMKNSQQKIRVANEMIIRYAKQAERINLPDTDVSGKVTSNRVLELYYDSDVPPTAKQFALVEVDAAQHYYDLRIFDCTLFVGKKCLSWGNEQSLLGGYDVAKGGIVIAEKGAGLADSVTGQYAFGISNILPAVLRVDLNIKNVNPNASNLNDNIALQNSIILESLK